MYRLTWRLPLAGLVAFSHLQFSQIRGRQPYLIVRKILYVIHAEKVSCASRQAAVAAVTAAGGASPCRCQSKHPSSDVTQLPFKIPVRGYLGGPGHPKWGV